ncbi:MAG: NnrS family protein [Pseudomonas sp.]
MQITDTGNTPRRPALLDLGFRPFFLGGCVFALLAIALWLLALQQPHAPAPMGGWLAWHRHELIFGFASAIIVGFLLTAVQTWTGRPSLSGKPLAVLVVIWLVARLSWWSAMPLLLLAANLLFLLTAALTMGRLLWVVRQRRNYPTVGLLVLLAGVDLLMLLGVASGNDGWQRQGAWAGVWLVAAMMGLIGGRVIPFFTQRGLNKERAVQPWPWLDWSLLAVTVALALGYVSGLALHTQWLVGVVFILLALGHAARWWRWYDRAIWRVPLLWSLYLAYGWLVLACVAMAAWHFDMALPVTSALHALTVGAMGGLILAMLARITLGHTGRPLVPPPGIAWAFALLNLGGLFRVVGVQFWYPPSLWLAGVCWCAAFGLFLYRYGPMLWRARVDGQAG